MSKPAQAAFGPVVARLITGGLTRQITETTMTNFPEMATIEASRIQREALAAPQMTVYEATVIAEGNAEIVGYDPEDEELRRDAWQVLIDTGTAWELQGWFGRTATALIQAGECTR